MLLKMIEKTSGLSAIAKLIRCGTRPFADVNESFLSGSSISYAEKMFEAWKADPKSVHVSWQAYFSNLSKGISPAFSPAPPLGVSLPISPGAMVSSKDIEDHLKIYQLITAYQLKGHELCDLDPLSNFSFDKTDRA
jgi:2-oxoglutarate dehydrogenase E1 component